MTDLPTDPLVSIVLPAYNQAGYLEEAIRSVCDQTYSAWELLVVNDGSTDKTADVLSGLADPRIRVTVSGPRAGPAAARNTGLALAKGVYVAFLDADDAWMSHKLECQISRMRETAGVGWSYSHFERIDAHGRPLEEAVVQEWHPHSGSILDRLITFDAIVATPTVVVERRLIEAVGGFDHTLRYCHDYDLWFRLAAVSNVLALPQRLSKVRSYANSHTRDRPAVYRSWVRTYDKLERHADRRIRALGRRKGAEALLVLAGYYFHGGERARAWAQLAGAARRAPGVPLKRALSRVRRFTLW